MSDEQETLNRVRFDYLKSNLFRVVHVDGAWGGITPAGVLNMVMFSERTPIPRQTTHEINPEGRLTEIEDLREQRDTDIVREMEVSAVMTLRTAVMIRDWLNDRIQQWVEMKRGEAGGDTRAEQPPEPSAPARDADSGA